MDESLVRIRHERSKKDFPFLALENDEFVEFAFSRAKICFMMIIGGVAAGLIVTLVLFLIILSNLISTFRHCTTFSALVPRNVISKRSLVGS